MTHTSRRPRCSTAAQAALLVAAGLNLTACHPVVAIGAVEAASVTVFGRGSVDMAYSAISGRDCSIVRLDRGESYCKPKKTAAPAEPFCTRTLGVAECFAAPAELPDHPPPLADGPGAVLPVLKVSKY